MAQPQQQQEPDDDGPRRRRPRRPVGSVVPLRPGEREVTPRRLRRGEPPQPVGSRDGDALPAGLADVLDRRGGRVRDARRRRLTDEQRCARLAEHLRGQVSEFVDGMAAAGAAAPYATRLQAARVRSGGPAAWAVRYWRSGSPADGVRSWHLLVGTDGSVRETADDLAALLALGDPATAVELDLDARLVGMGPLDARAAVARAVEGLADQLAAVTPRDA